LAQEGPANRRESLRGIPTKKGYDRDEYPPAMTDEGQEGCECALHREQREPQRLARQDVCAGPR
jgi:hypothetical protein